MWEPIKIEGKYKVELPKQKYTRDNYMLTDNPREAIYRANATNGTPINIKGDVDFYKEDGRWKLRRPEE